MKSQMMLRSNIQILCLTLSISLSSLPTFATLTSAESSTTLLTKTDEQLFKAIKENKPKEIETLLNKGARLDVRDSLGYMPLHHAILRSNVKIVQLLLDKNASLEATDWLNRTPLYCAVDTSVSRPTDLINSAQVIRLLLSRNAHIGATAYDGLTLLHAAIIRNSGIIINIILNSGVNKEALTRQGLNPLELAASMGKAKSVRTLLNAGFQTNVNTLTVALTTYTRQQPGETIIHMLLLQDPTLTAQQDIQKLLTSHRFDLPIFEENKKRMDKYISKFLKKLETLLQEDCSIPSFLAQLIGEYHNDLDLRIDSFIQTKLPRQKTPLVTSEHASEEQEEDDWGYEKVSSE